MWKYSRAQYRTQFTHVHAATHGSRLIPLLHRWKSARCSLIGFGDIEEVKIRFKVEYNNRVWAQVISRTLIAERTVVPLYLQPLRHPGPPALLQVIDLGANGGGLTTRRCRRRTSRAATTQAFPSERMLLRPRRSMTRLDPKRAAAAARCPTVLLEA